MLWWLSSIRIPKSNGSQAIKRWLRSVRIFNDKAGFKWVLVLRKSRKHQDGSPGNAV